MENIKICDSHNDFLLALDEKEVLSYIRRCKVAGVEKVASSIWSSCLRKEEVFKTIKSRSKILRDSDFLLHIEDLFFVSGEEELRRLVTIRPFSCSLTWNDENLLAGGSRSNGSLSNWGKTCVLKLAENDILIDLAHLNAQSFWQVAEILKTNIYVSHTGFCAVKEHPRNLTNKQIDKIVESGGFVGLFFFDEATKQGTGEFGVCDIVSNIKFFVNNWGCDNLGFGTDFYGIERLPFGIKSYDDFSKIWTALKTEGFTDEQLDKIFYKNFINFLNRLNKKTSQNACF